MIDIRRSDLKRLNSMTKYPSIPTYHEMGQKGRLGEKRVEFEGRIVCREKIDGTNARIIMIDDATIVGSREELLWAVGDLIGNPALGIVEALKPVARQLSGFTRASSACTVYYFEVFGAGVGAAAKEYSSTDQVSARLFDVAHIHDVEKILDMPPDAIAKWRDAGGQSYLDDAALEAAADREQLRLAPWLILDDASVLPKTHEETLAFLDSTLPRSLVALDKDAAMHAEGLIVRTPDRKTIAKMRFEDYRRTIKSKQGATR